MTNNRLLALALVVLFGISGQAYGLTKVPLEDMTEGQLSYDRIDDVVAFPEQYGAIPDDSSASAMASNVAAIHAALTAKNTVLITKTFYINDTITIGPNQTIDGLGYGLLRSRCSGVPAIKLSGNRATVKCLRMYGAGDYDTEFVGASPSVSLEDGVFLDTGISCEVSNCEIRLFKGRGISSVDEQNSKINFSVRDCYIKNNFQNGIYLGGVNSASIRDTSSNLNRGYNIYVASSSNSVTGSALELGVHPLINTDGLALYLDGPSAAGKNVFENCHIEDEYGSASYYIATASRMPLVVLAQSSALRNSYLRPGSGWVDSAVEVGPQCEVTGNSIRVRSSTYPVAGITVLSIASSEQSPLISQNSFTNTSVDLDDTGANGFKYLAHPLVTEIVVPYLFDCDGSGVASFAFPLPVYYASNRRLYAASLIYATVSSGTAFVDGDFKIGTTLGASDIFISTGTTPLENGRSAAISKSLGLTDGTNMPAYLFFSLNQRAGQMLKFWVRISLYQ